MPNMQVEDYFIRQL